MAFRRVSRDERTLSQGVRERTSSRRVPAQKRRPLNEDAHSKHHMKLEVNVDRELRLTRNVGAARITQCAEDRVIQVMAHPAMLQVCQF
jgi:hypothetical protein